MAIKLEQALADAGHEGEADVFRQLVLLTFRKLYPDWTDEELLYHPPAALRFCGAVNMQAGIQLDDHIILRTLINCRKRGFDPSTE